MWCHRRICQQDLAIDASSVGGGDVVLTEILSTDVSDASLT
jgi:hypothetical protein